MRQRCLDWHRAGRCQRCLEWHRGQSPAHLTSPLLVHAVCSTQVHTHASTHTHTHAHKHAHTHTHLACTPAPGPRGMSTPKTPWAPGPSLCSYGHRQQARSNNLGGLTTARAASVNCPWGVRVRKRSQRRAAAQAQAGLHTPEDLLMSGSSGLGSAPVCSVPGLLCWGRGAEVSRAGGW